MNHNPYAPPSAAPYAPLPIVPSVEVREIARWQRAMLIAWLVLIALRFLIGGWSTVVLPALAFVSFRLAQALENKRPWVWAVLAMVPFVNLISLLIMTRCATAVLTKAGIKVGLLGASIK